MFKNFWDNINNNPVLLAGIVQAIVPVLVVFEVVQWTEAQTAVLYTAVTAILTTFVRGNTVAVNKVEQRIEEKVAHREMAGTTGTGVGLTPPPTPGPATPGMTKTNGNNIGITILLVSLGLSILISACGANLPPNTSPEGKTAVRATQVVAGLRATLPLIKSMTCTETKAPPCLQPAESLQILDYMDKANAAAVQLATVLAVVDTTTDTEEKSTGLAKARSLMVTIQQILMSASVTPAQEPLRQQLIQTFNNISELLFAI